MSYSSFRANTKHLYNIGTQPAQRLRRWSNTVQMFYKCFVFIGFRRPYLFMSLYAYSASLIGLKYYKYHIVLSVFIMTKIIGEKYI